MIFTAPLTLIVPGVAFATHLILLVGCVKIIKFFQIKIRQVESIDVNADGQVDAESSTYYLVDAFNHTGYAQVLKERRVENGVEVKVTTYTIGHDVLSQFDSVNGYLALLSDGHGSTRAVADMDGNIVQEYNYDAYGNAHGFDAAQALTSLLYSGEQFNPVSGLRSAIPQSPLVRPPKRPIQPP